MRTRPVVFDNAAEVEDNALPLLLVMLTHEKIMCLHGGLSLVVSTF